MLAQPEIQKIRDALGYEGLSGPGILEALTAAGADNNNLDGNKRLAQMGTSLIEYQVIEMGYRTMMSRAKITRIQSTLATADYRALVAKHQGIDQYIKYSPSAGSQATSVLAQAVSALIGVLHLESRDPDVTREGMLCLGFLSIGKSNVDHSNLLSQFRSISLPQPTTQSLSPAMIDFDDAFPNSIGSPGFPFFAALPTLSKSHPIFSVQTPTEEVLDSPTEHENANVSSTREKRTLDTLEPVEQPNSKRQEIIDFCQASILRDTEKCKAQGLPPPRETFFSPHIQNRMLELNCKFSDASCTILAQIASSSSIVGLKEALECSRSWPQIQNWRITRHATRTERIAIIGDLEVREMYCALLKRYHVMELFRNCGGSDSRRATRMIICTGREIFQAGGKTGNPGHNDEAHVTERMMKEVFPSLQPGCKDYESKRRSMSRLRVLGRRLHMFAERFGNSSLAFMQPCKVSGDFEKPISDHMILAPNEPDFNLFLDILEESQGDLVRQFSTAADKIVRHLIYEDMDHPEPFHLEVMDAKEILEHPKGSPGLLRILN